MSAPSWMLRPGSCPHGKSIPGKGTDDGYAAQVINDYVKSMLNIGTKQEVEESNGQGTEQSGRPLRQDH